MLRHKLIWGIVATFSVAVLLTVGGRPWDPAPSIGPALAADFEEEDWEKPETKWVPIFSIQNTNIFLGAAQVAGPKPQVDKVKAVAELQLSFKKLARIRAYVPVSRISLELDRVQGVAVWALADLKVLGL